MPNTKMSLPPICIESQSTTVGPSSNKTRVSYDERFRMKSGALAEFIALRGRLPQTERLHPRPAKKKKEDNEFPGTMNNEPQSIPVKKQARDPYERGNAIFLDTCRQRATKKKMKPERIELLDSIHTGILSPIKTSRRLSTPLDGWTEKFQEWASKTTTSVVRSCVFPSTRESYVSSSDSFKQHMITKSGCHLKFKPIDCCPTQTKPGTMADVFSYALYPRMETTLQNNTVNHQRIAFDDIPAVDYDHHSGTFFPPEAVSSKLKGLVEKTKELLMPNDLMGRITKCKSVAEFDALMLENEACFDTFNYGVGGLYYNELCCIMDKHYPQPYRTSFSCTMGPSRYFPSLDSECLELYTYGANGRCTVDARCRPMPPTLYELGVEAWKNSIPHLSPMCKVCPPWNCQALMYRDLWVTDDENILTKKSAKNKDGLIHIKSEMAPHKDNGHRDDVSGKHHGANPDKEVNSHILGSDVLMVSIGNDIEYHLVRADYLAGQTYKFTQAEAKTQGTTGNSNKKRKERYKGLTKTVVLSNGSLYIHTAHDDEMYYHCLNFVTEEIKRNRVRLVLVFRWLSVRTFFRQNPQDNRCNRYSTVDKHAFESMDNRPQGELWWKAMGYIDQQGNNIITSLMDPIIPKEGTKTGKRKERKSKGTN